jgi:hypothetical protein
MNKRSEDCRNEYCDGNNTVNEERCEKWWKIENKGFNSLASNPYTSSYIHIGVSSM